MLYMCIYIYTYVYIIDKTYAIWVNSLVNLSIKHHQVVKMALWVYHSTWKNSSICGWWTYSTDIRFPQSPAKRWISGGTKKRLAWFSSDPNNNRWKWWNIFTFSHVRGVPQSTTRKFRSTREWTINGAHMVRPILPPRPGLSLHLAQAQWLWQKINGKQGQW